MGAIAMSEEKYDPQEQRRRAVESAPPQTSDAEVVRRENARHFREESERLQAERNKQEQFQRDRQAMHEELARRESDAIRAKIFMRVWEAEEAAKARAQAEVPVGPPSPPFRNEQLEAEQAAGRRALARHRGERPAGAAAVQDRTEEKPEATPGFKT